MDQLYRIIRGVIGTVIVSGALTALAWADSVGLGQIEPLVTHQTVAVAHLRLSQVDLENWHQLLVADNAEHSARSEPLSTPIGRLVKVLKDYGVGEAFFFFAIGTWDLEASHAAIDVADSAVEMSSLQQALRAATGFRAFRRSGRLLVMTKSEENLPPDATLSPRPDLLAALSTFPEADAVFALAISHVQRQAIALANPQLPGQFGGGPLSARMNDLRWLACAVDADDKSILRATIKATDSAAAGRLEGWGVSLRDLATQAPSSDLGLLGNVLTQMQLSREQNTLRVSLPDQWLRLNLVKLEFPRLVDASIKRLKEVSFALINFESVNGRYPAAASYDASGKPLLSWRVHVLPFLEHEELYQQFRLDEPWDSPHNKGLIPKMPEVFLSPASKHSREQGRSNSFAPIGDRSIIVPKKGRPIRDITDGTSKTIALFEVDDAAAPIWTQPDASVTDLSWLTRHLGTLHRIGFVVSLADGQTFSISRDIGAEDLTTLIQCNDGAKMDWKLLERFRLR